MPTAASSGRMTEKRKHMKGQKAVGRAQKAVSNTGLCVKAFRPYPRRLLRNPCSLMLNAAPAKAQHCFCLLPSAYCLLPSAPTALLPTRPGPIFPATQLATFMEGAMRHSRRRAVCQRPCVRWASIST